MRWLEKSPANRTSRCDGQWSHVVAPQQPRLQVDNKKGPVRKRGKGKNHQYLCMMCAKERYGLMPPLEQVPGQEQLFDGT